MAYETFAGVYDLLTSDIDYEKRARYVDGLIRRYAPESRLVLDLACGTGSLTVELESLGYDMIGVDLSGEMLAAARQKSLGRDGQALYLCQDMAELDLFGSVDAVVCMLDSLNHVTGPETLQRVFDRVALFLNPEGVFLFDVNTRYKQEKVLADNAFVYDLDEVFCCWQNWWEEETLTTEIVLDFFFPQEDGKYERVTEEFSERVYPDGDLRRMLSASGLRVEAVFGEDSLGQPSEEEQRLIYVVKKKKINMGLSF